jgi:hypothetical protein
MARITGNMKTLAHHIKTLIIGWLCLFSVASVNAIPNLVLCVGQDGHMELESAFDNRCGGTGQAPFVTPQIAPEPENHCGECSDIAIFSESVRSQFHKQNSGSQSESQSLGIITSTGEAQILNRTVASPRKPPLPSSPPLLLLIRSVRILV